MRELGKAADNVIDNNLPLRYVYLGLLVYMAVALPKNEKIIDEKNSVPGFAGFIMFYNGFMFAV